MGILSDIRVRQPAKGDLVGRQFTVTGIGTGFEGTIGMRLLNRAARSSPPVRAVERVGWRIGEFTDHDQGQESTAGRYSAHAAGLRRQPRAGAGAGQ